MTIVQCEIVEERYLKNLFQALLEESSTFKDIVVGDFIDAYVNMTIKVRFFYVSLQKQLSISCTWKICSLFKSIILLLCWCDVFLISPFHLAAGMVLLCFPDLKEYCGFTVPCLMRSFAYPLLDYLPTFACSLTGHSDDRACEMRILKYVTPNVPVCASPFL